MLNRCIKLIVLLMVLFIASYSFAAIKEQREVIPDFSESSVPVLNKVLNDLWENSGGSGGTTNVYNDVNYTTQYITSSQNVYDVTDYGAKGDGDNDDTDAIQDAVDALEDNDGGILYFPPGTYLVTDTIYLDSDKSDLTYIIRGDGKGSKITPAGADHFYIFKLNEDRDGETVITLPSHPKAIFQDLQIDAQSSTAKHSLCWYNEASCIMDNILAYDLTYLLTGTGYTDQIGLSNIYWQTTATGSWIYKQGGNGDSFYANHLFSGDMDTVYLQYTIGATILNCTGGHFQFAHCLNVTVKNCHMETNDNNYAITVNGSNVIIEDSYFNRMTTYEPIYLDQDDSYECKMDVVLRNNVFSTFMTASDDIATSVVKIGDFGAWSTLRLENNQGIVWPTGIPIWTRTGFSMEADDSTLNTFLDDNIEYLTGNVLLYYGYLSPSSQWLLEGITRDGRPINQIEESTRYVSAPGTMYLINNKNYPSSLAADEYFYCAAYYQGGLSTEVNTEESIEIGANDSVAMTFTTHPNATLRIWRGTATGVYDYYVDVPTVEGYFTFYDTGDTLSGFAWIDVGVPATPGANTTGTILTLNCRVDVPVGPILIDRAMDVAFRVEDDGVLDDVFIVNTTTGVVGVNTNNTSVIGSTPSLITKGDIAITNVDASSKSLMLNSSSGNQTWIVSHRGSGASPANNLSFWYYNGAGWEASPALFLDPNGAATLLGDLTLSGGNLLTGNIALEIGDAATDSITFVSDGTGNAEFTFPADVIGDADIDWGAGAGQVDVTDLETADNILTENEIDASSELANIMDDETGTAGALVFSTNPTLTGVTLAGIVADNDDMVFECDANNDGSNKYSFTDGSSAEVASIDESGNLTVTGTTSTDAIYGDPYNDYQTYKFASECLLVMSTPKVLFGWLTPSDAGTEEDLTNLSNDFTYSDASDFTSGDQIRKGELWTLDFDGTNDLLYIADDADFTFGDSSNDSPFSIFAYVYIANTATWQEIMSKYNPDGVGEWFFDIDSNEAIRFGFKDQSVTKFAYALTDSGLSVGWHFIVVTYDGTGGATAANGITIYIDGLSVASTATNDAAYVAMEDTNSYTTIGSFENGSSLFQGDLGIIGLTADELTADEVWLLYMAVRGYYNL